MPLTPFGRLVSFRALLALSLGATAFPPALRSETAVLPPQLAVVISIDQFRADHLVRFRPHFVEGGFKHLLKRGADFQDTHYRHAVTKTAPGHATILSGVHANVHGITHVPLLWFGAEVTAEVHGERVGVDDLAPTLAALLEVPSPPQAQGRRLF